MVDFAAILKQKEPLWLFTLPKGVVRTHYTVLLVPPAVPVNILDHRYRTLRVLHHPDRWLLGDAAEHASLFAEITEAYATIGHAERRAQYDRELALLGPPPCATCLGTGIREKQKSFTQRVQTLCTTCGGTGQKL